MVRFPTLGGRERLEITGHGLAVLSPRGKERARFAWDRVREVMAFKRDEWATDLICLEFKVDPDGWYFVHEELEGFEALAERLPGLLPGALHFHEWFSRVAFPAFAPNPTVIFSRSSTPLPS